MASQLLATFPVVLFLLFISPYTSLACSSQKFSNNAHFTNCTDLPSLESSLHWTFDPTKSSLSVAFISSPATPNGWIAWGLNPKSLAMSGTQSFIAFKSANGSVIVKTYNLISYGSIKESKLSYNVLDSKAESSSNGRITIFATLELPANTTKVNQVWQVGPSVKDGAPEKHSFNPENLKSTGILELVTSTGDTTKKSDPPTASSSSSTNSSSSTQSGNDTGGSSRILKSENTVFATLLFFLGFMLLQV